MHTIESIRKFCNDTGFKPGNTSSEIKELPNILKSDETLKGLLEGTLTKIHNRNFNGNGLAIATDKRVIFYRKSFIGTITHEEIPVTKISSVSFRKGLLLGSLMVITSNNEAKIENCDNKKAIQFSEVIKDLINTTSTTNTPIKETNTLDEIERLFELKQKGAITEDEYSKLKQKLF